MAITVPRDEMTWPAATEWVRLNPDGTVDYWHSTRAHREHRHYQP